MTIRLLPKNLINQIAAGEVVERPASVVKELVENAIDAGATNIQISIREGGRSYIAIRDNGHGIAKDDLSLALERHATSKLLDDDLFNIGTLGFRGEALPSIASVSRLSLTSRPKGADSAWSITVEGGEKGLLKPQAYPEGTEVEVKDLFFATPARLKFMRSITTETNHIIDVVQRLALAHPNIAFELKNDQKTILSFHKDDNALQRCDAVMGKDFTPNAMRINLTRDHVTLNGYASVPTFNRGLSDLQFLYVNNRPVKDKVLNSSIRVAYQDFLARDRHPLVVLFLTVPTNEVDVNVHPAKTEIRFREPNLIRSSIIGALKHTLHETGHRTSSTLVDTALRAFQPSVPYGKSHQSSLTFPLREAEHLPYDAGSYGKVLEKFSDQSSDNSQTHPLGSARAQILKTYILSESEDGFIIVDQHAAHERLVYEKMKIDFANNAIKRQCLLVPEIVELANHEKERLLSHQNELQHFGLYIEPFGGNAILIREVPSLLGDFDIKGLIRDLVDELKLHGQALSLKEKMQEILGTFACHSSIRAGRQLNIVEMNALLRQMENTPHSGQCNHGRPTYVKLLKSDIEKLFGRR